MNFTPGHIPPGDEDDNSLWFVFNGLKLLIKEEGDNVAIPELKDLKSLDRQVSNKQYLGTMDGTHCFAGESERQVSGNAGFAFKGIRALFGKVSDELVFIAGTANQLVHWSRNHKYCGKCGKPTEKKEDERAIICPDCGLVNYPRLSPAIIVAVVKNGRILLAQANKFPMKFYSVLAGFVEPGETLEECVQREVKEEVGIQVKNIKYFGSQPWPFPDSFMVGFTAEWESGEIEVDRSELKEAEWFSPQDLPRLPYSISIARRLIDWFSETYR